MWQGKLFWWNTAFGKVFQESAHKEVDYWFHIPIPTQIHKDNNGNSLTILKTIFIDHEVGWDEGTNGSVFIERLSLFDGSSQLYTKEIWGPVGGNQKKYKWDIVNDTYLTSYPKISNGLGISIKVRFGKPPTSDKPGRFIRFIAAGAVFEHLYPPP